MGDPGCRPSRQETCPRLSLTGFDPPEVDELLANALLRHLSEKLPVSRLYAHLFKAM